MSINNAWGRYRYQRMSGEEKFKLEVSRNLKILTLLGLERGEWETLQELRNRCWGRIVPVEDGVTEEAGRAEASDRAERAVLAETSGTAERSDLAEASGTAERSELAEVSGMAERSDLAEASGMSEKPDLAEASGTAERFDLAEASGMSERSDLAEAPGMSERFVLAEISGHEETFGSKETPASGQLRFIENYESVIYGGRSADEDMSMDAVNERHALLELLKRERRWAYVRWRMRAYLIRYR